MSYESVYRARHVELLAHDNPIVRAVAELHGPAGNWPDCHGCDVGGMGGEAPGWPCRTWELLDEMTS